MEEAVEEEPLGKQRIHRLPKVLDEGLCLRIRRKIDQVQSVQIQPSVHLHMFQHTFMTLPVTVHPRGVLDDVRTRSLGSDLHGISGDIFKGRPQTRDPVSPSREVIFLSSHLQQKVIDLPLHPS